MNLSLEMFAHKLFIPGSVTNFYLAVCTLDTALITFTAESKNYYTSRTYCKITVILQSLETINIATNSNWADFSRFSFNIQTCWKCWYSVQAVSWLWQDKNRSAYFTWEKEGISSTSLKMGMVWNYWTEQTRFIFISNWFLINSFLLLIVWQNLTQAITNEQRDSIVNTYVVHDILGCSVAGHVRVRCIEYIYIYACCNLLSLCIFCVFVCVPLLFLAQMSCAIYLTTHCYNCNY